MAEESTELNVIKATLATGKEVYIQEMEVRHRKAATQAAAMRAKENKLLFQIYIQEELLKILVVGIDGKKLKAAERETIESRLTQGEYQQVMEVLAEALGEQMEAPKVEHVSLSALSSGD